MDKPKKSSKNLALNSLYFLFAALAFIQLMGILGTPRALAQALYPDPQNEIASSDNSSALLGNKQANSVSQKNSSGEKQNKKTVPGFLTSPWPYFIVVFFFLLYEVICRQRRKKFYEKDLF